MRKPGDVGVVMGRGAGTAAKKVRGVVSGPVDVGVGWTMLVGVRVGRAREAARAVYLAVVGA